MKFSPILNGYDVRGQDTMKSTLITRFSKNQMSSNEMKKTIGGKSLLDTCLANADNAAYHVDNGLSSMTDKHTLFIDLACQCMETFGDQP